MTPLRPLILATSLLIAATLPAWATNPPGGTPPPLKKTCGNSGTGSNQSFEWQSEVGLARFTMPDGFLSYAHLASEANGNLPNFAELYQRGFSKEPLQESQVILEISQPQIGAALFHPSCLFLNTEATNEFYKKPAAGGFPEFIHQLLTTDRFTLIDLLPAPDRGWRLRVWRRDAAPLVKSAGFYVTTSFEAVTPLKDFIFKRPANGSDDNTLLVQFKEATGITGIHSETAETVQTVDSLGRPLQLTTKRFAGEGTTGPLLSQENLSYSDRSDKA